MSLSISVHINLDMDRPLIARPFDINRCKGRLGSIASIDVFLGDTRLLYYLLWLNSIEVEIIVNSVLVNEN